MQVLLNSLNVLQNNAGLAGFLLLAIGWGSLVILAALRQAASREVGDVELTALALAGWSLPLLLAAGLYFLLARLLPQPAARALILGVMVIGAALSLRLLWGRVSPRILFPLLAFLFFAFLRLGYAAQALLPPYFDSAFHYGLIQSILKIEGGAPLGWPLQGWYHSGYHLIAAGLVSFTGSSLARLMLLFGQLVLAALPLPLYPLVRRLGGSSFAGWLAVTLAAFAWSMPAHAVDWGKYPALLGLLLVEFGLGAALLTARPPGVIAFLAAPLIHTRALVLMGIASAAWMLPRLKTRWMMGVGMALLGLVLFWLARGSMAAAVLNPYLVWAGVPLLLLVIPAFLHFRGPALACLLAVTGMLGALLVPLTPALTLLDRPFVEMALFLPLALLAGLGADRLPRAAAVSLAALVLLLSFNTGNFTPSECCRLAGRDDLAALDWMDANLPREALVGIAAADLQITAEGEPLRGAGTDAGIWVEPLTGRVVKPLPYSTDFLQPALRAQVCAEGIAYLYVGALPMSFDIPPSEDYREIFALPKARIFQVACLTGQNTGAHVK